MQETLLIAALSPLEREGRHHPPLLPNCGPSIGRALFGPNGHQLKHIGPSPLFGVCQRLGAHLCLGAPPSRRGQKGHTRARKQASLATSWPGRRRRWRASSPTDSSGAQIESGNMSKLGLRVAGQLGRTSSNWRSNFGPHLGQLVAPKLELLLKLLLKLELNSLLKLKLRLEFEFESLLETVCRCGRVCPAHS